MKYDGSWADLSSVQRIKDKLEETLELALRAEEKDDGKKDYTEEEVKERMTFAKKTWRDLNQQQILDAPEERWASMLMSAGAEKSGGLGFSQRDQGHHRQSHPQPSEQMRQATWVGMISQRSKVEESAKKANAPPQFAQMPRTTADVAQKNQKKCRKKDTLQPCQQ